MESETKSIGQMAYEAYCDALVGNARYAEWLEVDPCAKVAWQYAAATVIQNHLDKMEG
jgi:hypothetical protein